MFAEERPVFWADKAAAEAAGAKDKLVVCCGITPSGPIHIGNLREVLTAEAVHRALKDMGKKSKLIYVADTFDPLRRVYPFLDQSKYEKFIGMPLSQIPCPCEKHENYAEHFLEPFLNSLKTLGVELEVVRADRAYAEGLYTNNIFRSLENTDEIRSILASETGKATPDTWSPANPICSACGRMTGTKVTGFSRESKTVGYECECGHKGDAPAAGGVKLTWRVDWPARWEALGVTVEPFGKDHASKGGSYDTGKLIAKRVFDYDPPYPVPYEWISLKGFGDMSSSKGNVVTIEQMLEVSPPEVLRYSVLKVKPLKSITFDPGLPLLQLIDEVDDETNKNRNQRAIELALTGEFKPLGVPFKHLVMLVQITGPYPEKVKEKLEENGYKNIDLQLLKNRLSLAEKWLQTFAPSDLKFELKESLPKEAENLSKEQKSALAALAEKLFKGITGDQVHEAIYQIKESMGLQPKEIFEAIYIVLLGKAKGPRAGAFLANLDIDWVKNRFKEAAQI